MESYRIVFYGVSIIKTLKTIRWGILGYEFI